MKTIYLVDKKSDNKMGLWAKTWIATEQRRYL